MQPYEEAWEAGASFDQFLDAAEHLADLWRSVARRVVADPVSVGRLADSGGDWRLLVLADDWCGDGLHPLAMAAALAEASPHLELRIVPRDRFPTVRDRHLTKGARAIPIMIVLDGEGRAHGHWGPRPAPLQAEFELRLKALPPADRFRESRRWHVRDQGLTVARELVELIEAVASAGPPERAVSVGP